MRNLIAQALSVELQVCISHPLFMNIINYLVSTARRNRLVSPPPRTLNTSSPPPPVPPLPRNIADYHFNGHRAPPVIVPNAQPFPFEAHIHRHPRRNATPVVAPLEPAPRSHHQPTMGFGGALMALNRQHAAEEAIRQRSMSRQTHSGRTNAFGAGALTQARGYIMNALREYTGIPHGPRLRLFGHHIDHFWEEEDEFDLDWPPKTAVGDVTWKPSFTHPEKPASGFTYHFELDENESSEASSSSSGSETTPIVLDLEDFGVSSQAGSSSGVDKTELEPISTLVCAHCLDPLVLATQSTSPEDSTARRIWALRCGHMLDGKCLESMMRPVIPDVHIELRDRKGPDHTVVDLFSPDAGGFMVGKGKGKAREEPPWTDWKGKGKAIGDDAPRQLTPSDSQQSYTDSAMAPVDFRLPVEANSMRSRLRSRGRPIDSSPATGPNLTPISPPMATSSRPIRPLPRRRGAGRANGAIKSPARPRAKGRARKPVVEETFDWLCPLPSCRHVHRSIRMTGVQEWKMDPSLGAVALFV